MRAYSIAGASHNMFTFNGTTQDGSEDDWEHGVGRLLLNALINNHVNNTLVVVLRWYGKGIGHRRFKH